MRFFLVVITCFLPSFFWAQNELETRTSELIQLLEKNWRKPINFQLNTSTTNSLLPYLTDLQFSTPAKMFDYEEYYDSYIDLTKKQIGLDMRADFVQNFNPSFQDIEDNILYRRRYQLGVEWNVLKNGYVDSREKLQTIEAERTLNEAYQRSRKTTINSNQRNACIAFFNKQKTQLLHQRASQLQSIMPLLEELFYLKKISLEVLYSFQARVVETNAQINIYQSYNDHAFLFLDSSLCLLSAPVFDLNPFFEELIDHDIENDSSLLRLQQQFIGQYNWYNDIQLKLYSRYSLYELAQNQGTSRNFFSVGLTTTIPLPFSHKEQQRYNVLKQEKQFNELMQSFQSNQLELMNELYEYRYILKQYVVFTQKLKLINETIRIEDAKQDLKDEDFNPLNGLKLLDEKTQIAIEMIDLQQKMYLKLLEIQLKTKEEDLSKLIDPIRLSDYYSEKVLHKNVYVWSKTLDSTSAELLSSYSIYNDFKTVLLAVTEVNQQTKIKQTFADNLAAKGLEVVPMIGQNSLLSSSHFKSDLANLLAQASGWNGKEIHLDIEPHTLSSWKTDQATAAQNYLRCIREAKAYCDSNHLALSISIPIHYDSTLVKELLGTVDQIHFMCYENIRPEYLERKLKPYENQLAQLTIALRTEDFKSRFEMEQFATHLMEITHINRFSYHDLGRLMQLDKRNLLDEEH